METLERRFEMTPAHQSKSSQHCAEMRFYVIGAKGAIQFVLYTGWYPKIINKTSHDGSGLNANKPFSIMIHEGTDGLWKFLESYYHETFEAEVELQSTEKEQ